MVLVLPSGPAKSTLAKYTLSPLTVAPTFWIRPEPVSDPATGSLAQTGAHVFCPQPAARKASSRSEEVAYTRPLATAGDALADDFMVPLHSGPHVARPQPPAAKARSRPSPLTI